MKCLDLVYLNCYLNVNLQKNLPTKLISNVYWYIFKHKTLFFVNYIYKFEKKNYCKNVCRILEISYILQNNFDFFWNKFILFNIYQDYATANTKYVIAAKILNFKCLQVVL